jgi:hypothetical protein
MLFTYAGTIRYALTYLGVPFNPDQLTRDSGFELLRKSTSIAAGVIKTLHFQVSFPMEIILKKEPAKVSYWIILNCGLANVSV